MNQQQGNDGEREKPVHLNQVFKKVAITEISKKKGDGIARIQGLVVFVKNTKIGDKVNVLITRVGSTSAEAEVLTTDE